MESVYAFIFSGLTVFQVQHMVDAAKVWIQRKELISSNFACCTVLLPASQLITIYSF